MFKSIRYIHTKTTSVNGCIFVNHVLLLEKVRKSAKFHSNSDVFDRDMTSSNFDEMMSSTNLANLFLFT